MKLIAKLFKLCIIAYIFAKFCKILTLRKANTQKNAKIKNLQDNLKWQSTFFDCVCYTAGIYLFKITTETADKCLKSVQNQQYRQILFWCLYCWFWTSRYKLGLLQNATGELGHLFWLALFTRVAFEERYVSND